VTVSAQAGDRYAMVPGRPRTARYPLVEAAVDARPPPSGTAVDIAVRSGVPPGCGTGTSAAVAVALMAALAAVHSESLSAMEAAYAAYRLEVEALGVESGIQDQLGAAFGGINYIEIDTYPDASVLPLPPWDDLDSRLMLVYLGRAHDSPTVHRQVIAGAGPQRDSALALLRQAATAARDAVLARDLAAMGRAMIANTEGQEQLHRQLVGRDARRVIELARHEGAIGWKVNGAGGDGGSLTLLCPTLKVGAAIRRKVIELDPAFYVIPVHMSPVGLQVRGSL
jgi:D-glycero-alpha-D-manno-heptose-7-phosphate kinase